MGELAAIQHITLQQGASYAQTIDVLDADGAAVDLIGCTATMQVRHGPNSRDVLIELSTSNGRLVIDGEAGTITLRLTAAETSALESGGVYDMFVTYPDDGGTDKLVQGTVGLSQSVTQ